jgi:hypothetical protein
MLPTAARWNTRATIRGETIEHEAAHAAAAHLLGFEVAEIALDRWADWGELGSCKFKWTETIDDEELAFARAVAAASGPFVTDSWVLDRSRQDRRAVEEVRSPAWSSYSWEFLVLYRTERLVRSEAFRSLHRRIVAALGEVGEVGTLSGLRLREVLTPSPREGLARSTLRHRAIELRSIPRGSLPERQRNRGHHRGAGQPDALSH